VGDRVKLWPQSFQPTQMKALGSVTVNVTVEYPPQSMLPVIVTGTPVRSTSPVAARYASSIVSL